MQVLWNGVPTWKFRPCRGVCQGCLLSHYLFILFIERLGYNIRSTIDLGSWTSICLACTGLPLSHIFFVDDLIIFWHSEKSQARVIKNIFYQFCGYSGHRINMQKTNIFFSKWVDGSLRRRLSRSFRFQEVSNLGFYLSDPLFHENVSNNIMRFVVKMVCNKLSS